MLTGLKENRKTTIRTIKSPDENSTKILCQCMCDLDVTREELLEAVQHIVETKRTRQRTTSTTPVPTTVAYRVSHFVLYQTGNLF